MRTSVLASVVSFALSAVSPAAATASGPTVSTVRAMWPIVREASGAWGVIGEVVARPTGAAVTVRSVTVVVDGLFGRPLQTETFDTPERLAEVVAVYAPDASGSLVRQPLGTLRVPRAGAAVVFVSALIDGHALPRRAVVAVGFTDGTSRTASAPLEVFAPIQRLAFPLRLNSEPWVVTNSAGTAHHWLGGTIVTNRDVFSSQRFAMDLLQIDGDFQTHPTGATTKEAYYAWGEDVVSAGHGRVVSVVADQPDLEIGEAPSPDRHPAGNHVVIQYGPTLFAIYAHLQLGSPTVQVGDWVSPKQVLGLVGNSGSSSEPHLHLHFTDRWAGSSEPIVDFYTSQGVPAMFWGGQVVRDGVTLPLRGTAPLEFDVITAR
jgi:Peptidase family M23